MEELSMRETLKAGDERKVEEEFFQYIVIRLGDEQYGIDIRYIDNIVRMQKITRVPMVQKFFKGVMNVRGEIIPVMSIRGRFGMEDDVYTDKTRIIILKPEQQEAIGILVDSVKEVVSLEEGNIEKVRSDGKDEMSKYITSVGKDQGSLISLLNIDGIIDVQ